MSGLSGPGHRVLVVGGARSGKSDAAQTLLSRAGTAVVVATGPPASAGDPEWAARVSAHVARRPPGWTTLETLNVADVLSEDGPPVLVDCVTLWLSRVLDRGGAWDERSGWRESVDVEIARLVDAWRTTSRVVVAVSNDVGSGVVPATASGRVFRDLQGSLNATLASVADAAYLAVAGRLVPLPAEPPAPLDVGR
jgi:adenosylcobinamide kinase/adenosylcobinamide-phosphate guanylyltransferase